LSTLQDFTDEQRVLLISLPFRTGLWVSESDAGGGGEASEAEMMVLESLITGYSEDFLKSEFVEELMRATLERRDEWDGWTADIDDVPGECGGALVILKEKLDARDVLSFRQTLMEIAKAVAMAYGEDEELSDAAGRKPSVFLKFFARFKGRSAEADLSANISGDERQALAELSKVLEVDLDGNPLKDAVAA